MNGPAPKDAAERDAYAREILSAFVRRAYRRPVDDRTVDRLVEIAKGAYTLPDQSFEAGIAGAMVAVLASPRFLFRAEKSASTDDGRHPLVDEYSLASRLSYFLWSTMPDDELLQLAERGELRANLQAQVDRMLKDPRSEALAENFAGQWLRARDVKHLDIDPVGALGLQQNSMSCNARLIRGASGTGASEKSRTKTEKINCCLKGCRERSARGTIARRSGPSFAGFGPIGDMFNDKLRQAMQNETEEYFEYVVRENRNVMELVDSNYTFLNETLAKHYDIDGVKATKCGASSCRPTARAAACSRRHVAGGDFEPDPHVAREARPVHSGQYFGRRQPPPRRRTCRRWKSPKRGLPVTSRRFASCRSSIARTRCAIVPRPDGPAGPGAWKTSTHWGCGARRRHDQPIDASGTLLTGEKFDGIRQLKADYQGQAPARFLPLFDGKAANLRPGAGFRVL